jgi:hypothetical protein
MIARLIVAGALTVVPSCAPRIVHHHVRPSVVVTTETNTQRLDVRPPQRLDIIMTLGGTLDEVRVRCDAMGGTDLTGTPDRLVCEGVDY